MARLGLWAGELLSWGGSLGKEPVYCVVGLAIGRPIYNTSLVLEQNMAWVAFN